MVTLQLAALQKCQIQMAESLSSSFKIDQISSHCGLKAREVVDRSKWYTDQSIDRQIKVVVGRIRVPVIGVGRDGLQYPT